MTRFLLFIVLGLFSACMYFLIEWKYDFHKPEIPNIYSRDAFGGWSDEDGDCRNTRAELLIQQSLTPVTFTSMRECIVYSGEWKSVYTGKTYYFAQDLDVDHVVPVKYAWKAGANAWSYSKRKSFYNDPLNLAIVESSVNRSKGALSIESWTPKENVAWYRNRWYKVILKYDLKYNFIEEE